ncbi:hypothetical protein HWV23_11385 [Natronomonas halophila]|uniref:hypothetical protein n=1 Tax=Natronomonas halophila TaxID=2747817 RepID=UPI0015B3F6F9|nr:hypothetical protein [Natronomonas halophila]QLD86300.1 hypothetical protein HWV23_11385 [Natronomonas halophila]
MRRRRYLALLGTAASAAVAGCSDGGSSTETPTPTPSPTPTREDLIERYRSELDGRDINVQRIQEDGPTLLLDYYSDAGSRSGFREEVQRVAAAAASAYGQYLNVEVDRFEVTGYAYNDDVLGEFHIEAAWVEQLMRRELSEAEYLQRVQNTVSAA